MTEAAVDGLIVQALADDDPPLRAALGRHLPLDQVDRPAPAGLPPHHPPMASLPGVPTRVRNQALGEVGITHRVIHLMRGARGRHILTMDRRRVAPPSTLSR